MDISCILFFPINELLNLFNVQLNTYLISNVNP